MRASRSPAAIVAFPYSRGDRKCSLLIGRDLKCVALALTATTRACGSRLAHFLRATVPRRDVAPDSKRSHVENSRSRDRARRRRGAVCASYLRSLISYLAAFKAGQGVGDAPPPLIIRDTCESVGSKERFLKRYRYDSKIGIASNRRENSPSYNVRSAPICYTMTTEIVPESPRI